MQCKLPNFGKLDEIGVPAEILELQNFDDMVKAIMEFLAKNTTNFSLSEEGSLSPEKYKNSVDLLIDKFENLLDAADKNNPNLDLKRGGKHSEMLKANLKNELYPKGGITRDEEVDLSAVIDGQLASREEIAAQRLNKMLDTFFANNLPAREYFKTHFGRELGLTTVVRIGQTLKDSSIVDSQKALNENIEKFMSNQYLILYRYLNSLGLAKGLPNSMFRQNKPIGTYVNTLDRFYNLVMHKSKIGTLEDEIEQGWQTSLSNETNSDNGLFKAVNAYLSIVYFDKLAKEAIGDYISSNKDQDFPIEVDSDGATHYKYRFGKDTENRVHGWQIDVRDALKEMGNFSKFLISSIPIDDTYLTPVNYLGAFTNLFGKVQLLLGGREEVRALYNDIVTFNQDPINKMRNILSRINKYDSVRDFLLKGVINPYEMKVFDAVYEYVFRGNNSLFNIESAYNRVHGLTNRYPLVESLAAQIGSSTEMSYLQTTFDYNTNQYVTTIKKKYQTKKQFFDMIKSINSNNQVMEEVEVPYKFLTKSANKYSIDFGDYTLEISVTPELNPYGILTKWSETKGITVTIKDKKSGAETSVESLFTSKDLSTKAKRQVLVDSINDDIFMKLLEFVDFFTGTGFTSTQDGLLEFELFKNNFKKSPIEALLTAVRGMVVRDIHTQFRKAVEDGQYTSSQLDKFILDTGIYKDSILGIDPTEKDWKTIWEAGILGPDLITVSSSQDWVDDYVTIKQIMSGEISKANTKNILGDSLPNYGLAFMGADIHTIISDIQHKSEEGRVGFTPLDFNLIMQNPNAIKGTVIDTDVRLADGTTKQIKNMTEGELFYHAIVNKFLIPITSRDKYIIVQPTTYSDKTKFVNYMVSTIFNGKDLSKMSNSELESLYINSIGEGYKTVLQNVLYDYARIFDLYDEYNEAYTTEFGVTINVNNEGIRKLVTTIDRRLNSLTEDELVALARQKGIKSEILADTHFRYNKNRKRDGKQYLAFNESLYHYATKVYTKQGIKQRLNDEKRKFLNQLLKNKISITGISMFKGQPDPESVFTMALKDLDETPSNWIQRDGTLTLAKVNDENIVVHNIFPEGTSIELNPILDKYFMLNSLLGNNLRMVLTGSEINHKNKHLAGINPALVISQLFNEKDKAANLAMQNTNIKQAVEITALQKGLAAEDFWKSMSLIEAYDLIDNIADTTTKNKVKKVIDKKMYEVESAGQGAQLKRNVIIPATMRYYTQNSLRGIPRTMRIAVMKDIPANVFNFTGDDSTIDSHDGAAFINPITSILENWSLQENEVGTVKKPIWHYYDKEHMTASLVKFAAHTITNNMMQQSEGSRVIMLNMFKKMANKPWALQGNILSYAAHKPDGEISFQDLTDGNALYYKGPEGIHYKIVDFGYDDGVYWTDEIRVNDKGIGSKTERKYHYFDANSNHIIATKKLEGYHTMSSIYEAHQIFGGIYSESLIGEGRDAKLQYSEASNYVVANLVNNVTILTELGKESKTRELNQNYYEQPLKTLMIDYLCNDSAIKNGAGNRNNHSRFYNDEALDTITLGTEYYGIQMDADHEADEAKMTEFSQVISALDAGGRLHNYVKGIYQALGQIALEEASIEMEAITAYQQNPSEETRDALYDIIGRTIINNISTARGQAGLAESIIGQIKRKFNLTSSHNFDDLKIPFSDANIYSNILSTFASIITNKSIRKKYPGLGAVLSPGFNIMMVYDIDGRQYQYKDLVKEATIRYTQYKKRVADGAEDPEDAYFKAIYEQDKIALENGYYLSSEQWNKQVVEAYLMKKTDDYNASKWKYKVTEPIDQIPDWDLHTEEFMPTDNVGVLVQTGDEQHWEDVSLDSIPDYYLFKADPRAFMQDKLGQPVKILQFRKNLHKARNLAPTKIWWDYEGEITTWDNKEQLEVRKKVTRTTNIFNSIHLLRKFAESQKGDKQIRINNYIERLKAQGVKEYANTQQLLDELDEGSYNGVPVQVYNTPAELIMSNIYQSRFGVDIDESMIDVIKNGPKAAKNVRQVHQSVTPNFYDLVMTKANGRHTYISLDRTFESTIADEDGELPDVSYRWTSWKDRHRKTVNDPLIVNEVYATNKEQKVLFRIGRDIRRPDLAYSVEGKYYYDKNTHEKVTKNERRLDYKNGEVIEYVEFVTRHEVKDHGRKHTVLNINLQELKRTITPREITLENGHTLTPEQAIDQDANTYIQQLCKEIYEADSYETFTVNNQQVKRSNLTRLQRVLEGFAHRDKNGKYIYFGYDTTLTNYLEAISEQFSKIPEAKEFKRPDLSYDADTDTIKFIKAKDNGSIAKIIEDRTKALKARLNQKKYYSFLRSQYYTASRIPAQTLQSFMNMRQVGYTAEGSNLAYVSHWQTWLQGSDYDIDKAYIMGLAFDDNGQYIGWSSLFNYNSLETIQASEYLPLPKNGVIIQESESGVDISEDAAIIKQAREILQNSPDPKTINEWTIKKVLAYARILNKLGDGNLVKGADSDIIEDLNNHNATRLPADLKAAALRNFISVHIQNTIQNIRNAADSYVPVDMEDLRKAADNSPKGAESLEISLVNPLSIYTMQYQNMTGKNVIAISATGQKGAFMWMYYLNDTIKNAKEGIDYIVNEVGEVVPIENTDFAYSRFEFTTDRIAGRSKTIDNVPQTHRVTSTTLPDVNIEDLQDINLISYIESGKLHSSIPIDIMISQMISAATDNAKELILAKINAGSKLAKCYLFLMTLGYDINDIVKFMTSDAVSWVDSLSDPNIFLGQELRPDEAITEIEKYLKNYDTNKDIDHYEDEFGEEISSSRNRLSLLKSIIPSDLTASQRQEALADIAEFKRVMEGSDEFSTFGRFLSINQGLPGKAEDLEGVLSNIKKIITKREKDLGIVNSDGVLNEAPDDRYLDIAGGMFDPVRWLQDEEYQARVAEYYNTLKVTLNIFAIAPKLPHFKSMFKLLGGECTVNQFSVKSKILSACLNKIAKECPKLYLDDKYYSRILGFASSIMMQQFIIDNGFKFPVKGSILDSNRTISNNRSGILSLDSEEGIASFKYYFENVVIPGLKAGTYGEWDDETKEIIRRNPFIQSLMRGSDRDVPVWKTNVNISSDSSYTRVQLSKFSKGLNQLSNYKIGNLSISDWFAVYNLIVNKNQYGSDRLTKIFEGFIKEFDNKGDNIINRYLKYVGEHDYSEREISNMMDFTAMDLFISQARVVSSLKGQKDPVVIVYEDKVPVYYKNVGFNRYEKMDNILPALPGESIEQKLHRFYLDRAYFILGKPYSNIITKVKDQLNQSPAFAIAELMRQTKLLLDINCA